MTDADKLLNETRISDLKANQLKDFKEMAKIAERKLGHECKKCYGTGHAGFDVRLEQYAPCDCVIKAARLFTIEKMKNARNKKELVN